MAPPIAIMNSCENCGKEFTPKRWLQARYCSKRCNTLAWERGKRQLRGSKRAPTYGFSLEQRLLYYRQIDPGTGCWIWSGCKSDYGHGQTYHKSIGKTTAHRASAVMYLGLNPKSVLQVLHRCATHSCFNPDHLYLGTHDDNMRDRKEQGGYATGEANNRAKLNWHAVRLIRELRFQGYSQERLAKAFGVNRQIIRNIVLNKAWVENVG